jgi:hypothetical protein
MGLLHFQQRGEARHLQDFHDLGRDMFHDEVPVQSVRGKKENPKPRRRDIIHLSEIDHDVLLSFKASCTAFSKIGAV